MNAHGLPQHLGERTGAAKEIVVAIAGADLVACENAILELVVEGTA
jgi:hypothetical protein